MANGKSQSNRRRGVRQSVPRPTPRWLAFIRQREVAWAALFVLMIGVLGSAIAVTSRDRPSFYHGQIIDRPIVPRVAFEAINHEETRRKRDEARSRVEPVFVANKTFYDLVQNEVLSLLSLADKPLDEYPLQFRQSINLDRDAYDLLVEFTGDDAAGFTPEKWNDKTSKLLWRLFNLAILAPEQQEAVMQSVGRRIKAIHPDPYDKDNDEFLFTERVLLPATDTKRIAAKIASDVTIDFPVELRDTVQAVIMRNLQPTYYLDQELTEKRRQTAADRVPDVKDTYHRGAVLFEPGVTVGTDELALIAAENAAYREKTPAFQSWISWLGTVGLVLIIGLGVWVYVFSYGLKVRRNPMRGFALTGLLLLCQGSAVLLVTVWPEIAIGGVTFATLFGAVILAVVYDQRFAFAMGAALTLLIVLSLRLPVSAAIVMMAGVGVAVAQLDEVRSRSKLVRVGVWAGIAMGTATFIGGLAERSFDLPAEWAFPMLNGRLSAQWGILASDVLYSLLAGATVGLLVQGILPSIERVFHVTTAMTLRELNDASHPLLQRLVQEAPGTYQHSLRIADMTEAAAEAIGADGLLCRVGAMYHDIGKVNKPSYFIENQGGGPNKHNKLSPAMSLLIIVGHVKDGIEMAREYYLPPVIRHFIESHHGTTLVEYFYHAAKKQKAAEDKPAPSEFEFRYPGPKPQTKEAAIMLLCDGIEGAARAMDEPTAVRLEQLVHAMANKRLMDGQFDECNMTLRDLSKVEAAITKTLCAVYHTRIKYPDGKKAQPPPQTQPKLA